MSSMPIEIRGGRAFIGGIAASDLVLEHGSPLYAYDASSIRARVATFQAAIEYRPLEIYYAAKANPAPGILRLLRGLGLKIDACSSGDVAFARAAGFQDAEISYVSHSMSDTEIELVARSGVSFVADSVSQIERISRRAPGSEIGVRINCDVVAGPIVHARAGAWDSKFGIHPSQLSEAMRLTTAVGTRVVGLHAHISSDVLDAKAHLDVLDTLRDLADEVEHLQYIDIGGGWGVPFLPEDKEYEMAGFGAAASERMAALSAGRSQPVTLRAEPGAYFLMDSGVLLTTVTEIKSPVERDGRKTPHFACVDASSNQLISAVIYEAHHPVVAADNAGRHPPVTYHISGNLMQGADLLAKSRELPGLQEGDVLVIGRAGAYSSARAPTFNERPRPAELLVDGDTVEVLRRAETNEDLLRPFLEVEAPHEAPSVPAAGAATAATRQSAGNG